MSRVEMHPLFDSPAFFARANFVTNNIIFTPLARLTWMNSFFSARTRWIGPPYTSASTAHHWTIGASEMFALNACGECLHTSERVRWMESKWNIETWNHITLSQNKDTRALSWLAPHVLKEGSREEGKKKVKLHFNMAWRKKGGKKVYLRNGEVGSS